MGDLGFYSGYVIPGFARQAPTAMNIVAIPARPRIIGPKETGEAVDLVHLTKISRAGENIVTGIVGIRTKIMSAPQFLVCCRHHLHQPHRPRMAGDRPSTQMGPPAAFDLHDRPNPFFRNAEPFGCLGYITVPLTRGGRNLGLLFCLGAAACRQNADKQCQNCYPDPLGMSYKSDRPVSHPAPPSARIVKPISEPNASTYRIASFL